MNNIEILSNANIEDVSLIFHSLLNRTPILIKGEIESKIEEFINFLSTFLPFRNMMIFYDDFTSSDDYLILLENEDGDIETLRNTFICFPFALHKLSSIVTSFSSWIIGSLNTDEKQVELNHIIHLLYEKHNFFLEINIDEENISTQLIGNKFPIIELDFEKWLFQNAIHHTENSIEKMKRVISKSVKLNRHSTSEFESLMNFTYEEQELKINLLKKEIINFYEASKRTFSILNRIKSMESFGISTCISNRILYSTISYKFCSISRILDFIEKCWKVNFFSIVNTKKTSNFSDTFESLWG